MYNKLLPSDLDLRHFAQTSFVSTVDCGTCVSGVIILCFTHACGIQMDDLTTKLYIVLSEVKHFVTAKDIFTSPPAQYLASIINSANKRYG